MKVIPLGLQCSTPEGIKRNNLRDYSYPFDWLWTPSKTTYHILHHLMNKGIASAVEYMTTGYTYYRYLNNEHYESVEYMTESQMNRDTGLGNTHFTINDEYKQKLTRRFERMLRDIHSGENILFLYADAANPYLNYHLDEVEYGVDATEYLVAIYELMHPYNSHIRMVYLCWKERAKDDSCIEYVPYEHQSNLEEMCQVVTQYLHTFDGKFP